MDKRREIYTTGQVAAICNVAPRTVTKWFDSGKLRGYRIPGGKDRRIPAAELIRFMTEHNIPTDAIEQRKTRILVIDCCGQTEKIVSALKQNSSWAVRIARSNFEAGMCVQKFLPEVIIINITSETIDAETIRKSIRCNEDLPNAKVIAFAPADADTDSISKDDYDQVISNHTDLSDIITQNFAAVH